MNWINDRLLYIGGAIGALMAIVAGWGWITEIEPFAWKAALYDQQRRDAFNRISDLDFQINSMIDEQTRLQGADLAKSQTILRLRVSEKQYIECTFQFVAEGCPASFGP